MKKCTIAKSRLSEFEDFILGLGYELDSCEGKAFQVMRIKIPNYPMGILFNGKSPVHYSANEAAMPFVTKFIRRNKQ